MTESRAEHSARVTMAVIVTEGDRILEFGVSRIGPDFAFVRDAADFSCRCRGVISISVDGVLNSFHCRFPDGIKAGTESKTRYIRL
jgi:hypothetical protein